MNRFEFMNRLSFLLADLPENERAEAIQYYEDYLDDAGVENEEEVLKSLGTPKELAASIREGLKEDSGQQGEFSENGFFEKGAKLENEVARRDGNIGAEEGAPGGDGKSSGYGSAKRRHEQGTSNGGNAKSRSGQSYAAYDSQQRAKRTAQHSYAGSNGNADHVANPGERFRSRERRKGMSGGTLALIVLLCIVAAPVIIPVAAAVAVVIAVLIFVAVLLAGIFLLTGIICVVAGVISLGGAVVKVFLYPAGAVLMIGLSLLTIGVGILLTVAVGKIISQVFPAAFNGLAGFVGGLFHRKGGTAA